MPGRSLAISCRRRGDSSHIGRVGTCRQTSVPIDLYGPLRDDIMGLPQNRSPANRERSEGTERGTGAVSNQPARRGQPAIMRVEEVVDFPQASIGADGPHLEQEGVGPPYFWAGHQIRYQRREVLKWFVEHTGPYARCGSECGRAFPLRDFKKVTDQQRGLLT